MTKNQNIFKLFVIFFLVQALMRFCRNRNKGSLGKYYSVTYEKIIKLGFRCFFLICLKLWFTMDCSVFVKTEVESPVNLIDHFVGPTLSSPPVVIAWGESDNCSNILHCSLTGKQ